MKMSPLQRVLNPIDLQSTSDKPETRPSERKNMKSTVPRRKTGSAVIKVFKNRQSDRYGACHVSQNAMLLMEAHAHLTNGFKSKERLLLLFTDSLIIAKTKSLYLKLKACVSLSDIWLASCIHIITDRKVTSKHSFVIGWPTTNYVVTFSSSETKERWLQDLQWHTCRARQRVMPNAILLYVLLLCHPDDSSSATVAVAVDMSTTAENVVHYIKQECKLLGEASDYQLCVNYEKGEETYTLIGHELPFFILRHSFQSQQEHRAMPSERMPEAFTAAQQTEATIKTPHFTLKTRTHPPGFVKHKRKRSLIDWALRRGHLNQSNDIVEQHNTPQKLFGQSLSSICRDGNLPKPIMDLLYLLFSEGPETCGIFRRSANAKSCRILKERMNSGKSVSLHDESVFVSASLITEFLRELPDGVLCCNLYEEWIDVLQIEDQQHKLFKVRSLLGQLPEENFTLLCHLFGVLHRIHSHSHVNLMTASNLALCIAPNMLWRPSQVDPELEGKSTLQVAKLIQYLIENTPAVFGDDLERLFSRRIISEQDMHESADCSYLEHSSSEETDQDFIASPPLSPEVHPLFLPLAALSLKEKRRTRPFHVDVPSSQGTYSCGTLDSISSQSNASVNILGVGKLSKSRDRCLSEPSMCFATSQAQMSQHTSVIRQSSYDAAVIDSGSKQSRNSSGLNPEQQSHNSMPGTRRRRYTFWKSPQIPSRFKHPAQKLASLSSLSSATTSSLSSLDSTLSLNSADPISSPQDTQGRPFLFGASARLQPLTPEMSRKCWTNVFTYEEEVDVRREKDQELENNEEECETSHEETVENKEAMSARQCVSSDASKTEVDVDPRGTVQEIFCTNTGTSDGQVKCLEARSMHASGGQKVSRMKITFFPSASKVMLKHLKVKDQTSKSVPRETQQNVNPEAKGEPVEVHVPQTLFYGHDVPLVLRSETYAQMSIQVNTRGPSFEDVGVKDAENDVSMADTNSSPGNRLCGYREENAVQIPGNIIENEQPAVSISGGSSISRSISLFHANPSPIFSKPASKFAGTFRHTVFIKLPVNVRNRGPAQNKKLP